MHFTVTLAGLKIIVRNIEDFVVQRFVSGPTLVSCDVSCSVLWKVTELNRASNALGNLGRAAKTLGTGAITHDATL